MFKNNREFTEANESHVLGVWLGKMVVMEEMLVAAMLGVWLSHVLGVWLGKMVVMEVMLVAAMYLVCG